MTPAELSAQIARATTALSNSSAMEQLRQSMQVAQRARRDLQEQAEVQRTLRQIASFQERRAREMEARRLEDATQTLDAAQRSRLRRVIFTWDQQVQAQIVLGPKPPPRTAYSRFGSFRDDSGAAYRPASLDFIDYLENAHRHPAIARKGAGVRWWFQTWRQVALQALREGVGASQVSTIVESVPRGKRRFRRRPRKLSITRVFDWMRKRITPVIHPNPPNGLPLHSKPVIGGEPAAIQA